MSYAKRFLAASLATSDLSAFLKYGRCNHLFDLDPVGKPAHDFIVDYVEKTGKLPPIDLVEEESEVNFTIEDAAPEWLHAKATEEHVRRAMKLMVQEAKDTFQDDPLQALKQMSQAIYDLEAARAAPNVSNFKDAINTLWPYLLNKWNPEGGVVEFGWHYLDSQSGGLQAGDMISLVGQPGKGKTWFMLWIALNIWRTLKQPVVFVSLEMSKEQVLERLAAMYTSTPADFFKFGQAPSLFSKGPSPKAKVKQQLSDLQKSDMPDLIVVDGTEIATVEDVIAICRQYGAAACLIDAAYALDTGDGEKNIYAGVAKNVKALKRKLAAPLQIPVLASWQFENLKNLKKGDKPDINNIGYTRAIAEYSSIILALMQEDDQGNAESLFQRIIDVLKGRNGEVGQFRVKWDFTSMDFGELDKAQKTEVFN